MAITRTKNRAQALAGKITAELLAVPLRDTGSDLGLLSVDTELPRDWNRHEVETVSAVAEALAVALHAAQAEQVRRRAERDLRESQERLQIALWASNVGLWWWNPNNDQVFFTAEWKRQLGYDDHEIANDFACWDHRLHPEERDGRLIRISIRDCGPGFDWRRYLDLDESRALHPNGRGIAVARHVAFRTLEFIEPGNEVIVTLPTLS